MDGGTSDSWMVSEGKSHLSMDDLEVLFLETSMLVKQCHQPSLRHHHSYRWFYSVPKWVVYGVVLPAEMCENHWVSLRYL